MNIIVEDYFKSNADMVTFIEMKDDKEIGIKGYSGPHNIPMPIPVESLVSEVNKGEEVNKISLLEMIDGMIMVLGLEEDFPYEEDYKDILYSYDNNIDEYGFYKGIKAREDGKLNLAGLFFRGTMKLNKDNVDSIFNYGLVLEEMAKGYFEKEEDKTGESFLNESTRILESILNIDDEYSLAYYKLGYHYKYFGQFLKAKLIWEKFLIKDKVEERLQDIREEIHIIEDEASMETGITYLEYGKYDEALESFNKLLKRHDGWWELKYLIGNSYSGLGEYHKAIDVYEEALSLYKDSGDLYNELGITLFNIEDIERAVEVFSEGIDNVGEDHKLLFNRGIGYLQLGNLEKAYIDIEKAYIINPEDENIKDQWERLKEYLNL